MAEVSETPQQEVRQLGQSWHRQSAARELGQGWKVRPDINLEPDSVTTILDTDGPGYIRHIWMTMEKKWWREIVLRFYWDGEETPSVESPVGDFFCSSWNEHADITAIPINVNPLGGLNCFFPMPFRKHVKVTVENLSPEVVVGFFYAFSCSMEPVGESDAYFHARFRRTNPVPYESDYTILDAVEGRGHFVGTFMAWQQNSSGWWGEGEFKAFLDGDTEFPSICGTGTEDYFGGAWAFERNFSAPFFGYPYGSCSREAGNRHTLYRFHVADPIRFRSDIRVTIQTLGWRKGGRFLPLQDDVSSVAYWYQTEPHVSFPDLPARDELEIV